MGTRTINKSTSHSIGHNVENGQGKIANKNYIVILQATVQKEDIEKE